LDRFRRATICNFIELKVPEGIISNLNIIII
jgi:hypothetical protein